MALFAVSHAVHPPPKMRPARSSRVFVRLSPPHKVLAPSPLARTRSPARTCATLANTLSSPGATQSSTRASVPRSALLIYFQCSMETLLRRCVSCALTETMLSQLPCPNEVGPNSTRTHGAFVARTDWVHARMGAEPGFACTPEKCAAGSACQPKSLAFCENIAGARARNKSKCFTRLTACALLQ